MCDAAPWGCALDTSLARASLGTADLEQDLRRLTGGDSSASSGSAASALAMAAERRVASAALAGLIKRQRLTGAEDAAGSCVVTCRGLDDTMRLDTAAVRALNLLPPSRGAGGAGGTADSVLSLLAAHCLSRDGARLLQRWLLQPLVDARRIGLRQGAVQAMLEDPTLRDALQEGLRVPDLTALARRLQRRSATLLDICRLHRAVSALPSLADLLEAPAAAAEAEAKATGGAPAAAAAPPAAGASAPAALSLLGRLHARLVWCAGELDTFDRMVSQVILDPTDPEPRVNPRWDDSLADAAEAIDACERDRAALLEEAGSGWGRELGVKLERDKTHGLVFRCLRKHDRLVRKVPGVMVLTVLRDGVRFTTAAGGPSGGGLKRVARSLLAAEASYREQQQGVVASAVDVVRTYCPVLEAASAAVAELDALRAFACAAAAAPSQYVRPVLVPTRRDADGRPLPADSLEVLGARHPVLEAQAAAGVAPEAVVAVGGGSGFVPNDYVMGAEGGLLHLVTGPNMGGKSTYIRTLGTLCVMAQAGCFVPADKAVLPVLDSVQARVGAGDAQVRGVSTFMAEMLEAGAILDAATPASLVIVDELGRGTSTYDGFGLAWAIAERLASSTRCLTLFATHFHELTALSTSDTVPEGSVRNRHVTASVGGDGERALTMLYRVRDGACPSSFGVHVAALAGFPAHLVEAARGKAAGLERLAKRGRAILQGDAPAAGAASVADTATPPPKAAAKDLARALAAAGRLGDRTATLAAARAALARCAEAV